MNENLFFNLEFKADIPQPIESKNTSNDNYVRWGLDNRYGQYLVDKYNTSTTHSGIINNKVAYTVGNGIGYEKSNEPLNIEVNGSDSITEFINKCVLDYFVFGSFSVEVCFNSFNEPIEYNHIPFQKVRMNIDKSKFWYNKDWMRTSTSTIVFDRYSPNKNSDANSKIFMYDKYNLSNDNVYPIPEYYSGLKSIETEAAIADYHFQNITSNFSPSAIIQKHSTAGLPEDKKREQVAQMERYFTGTKGGKYMIDFLGPNDKPMVVEKLTSSDADKLYLVTAESVLSNIMYAHGVNNAALFGLQTPGKLGNTQEIDIAYNIFKSNYVANTRRELESAFNKLFSKYPLINGRVKFLDKRLYEQEISDDLKTKIFTINELRDTYGLKPLPNGDRLLSEQPVSAPVQNEAVPVEDVKKKTGYKLTEEDYEKVKDLGVSAEEFEVLEEMDEHQTLQFDKESDISQYILDNDMKGLKIDELVKVLKAEGKITTTSTEVDSILNKMKEAGLVNIDTDKDGRLSIKPLPKPEIPDTNKVTTMYRYIKKPEATGGDLIPTSRSFCVKLIENNRLYTREEIANMGTIFGYDVFAHAGGYWYDPIEDKTNSSCRHKWQGLKVKPKNN